MKNMMKCGIIFGLFMMIALSGCSNEEQAPIVKNITPIVKAQNITPIVKAQNITPIVKAQNITNMTK